MSLVNEALKKARLEAERQRAVNRGVPMPQMDMPSERRRGFPALLAALAGAALALAIVSILLWVGRPQTPGSAAATASGDPALGSATGAEAVGDVAATDSETGSVASAAPGSSAGSSGAANQVAAAAAAPGTGNPDPTAGAADEGRVSPPASTPDRRERAPAAGGERLAANDPSAAADDQAPRSTGSPDAAGRPAPPHAEPLTPAAPPTVVEPETRRAAIPEPPAAPPERQTFVREAELADTRLELSGIAWGAQPFALINGRVVAPGDRVEGYRIVSIEPREVELEGAAGSIVIRLQ